MSDFIPYLSKSLGDKSYSRFTETWRQRSTSGRSIDGGLYGQCAQFPTIKDDEIIRGKMRRKCSGIVCTCVYTFSMTICIDHIIFWPICALLDHPCFHRFIVMSNLNIDEYVLSLDMFSSTAVVWRGLLLGKDIGAELLRIFHNDAFKCTNYH